MAPNTSAMRLYSRRFSGVDWWMQASSTTKMPISRVAGYIQM